MGDSFHGNIGADVGLWNNRLVMTAEYYYSKTTDMLYAYDVPVPPFAYDKLLANIGSMSNQGLEIGFSVTPVQKKDMELNINMNWRGRRTNSCRSVASMKACRCRQPM